MSRRSHRGFTLIELMVVVAIIGVLVGMLIPAVSMVHEASKRTQCASNLYQQGVALHAYHDVYGVLPPSRINPGSVQCLPASLPQLASKDFYRTGTYRAYNHTGFTLLLPFIGEENLYRDYRFDYPSCNA